MFKHLQHLKNHPFIVWWMAFSEKYGNVQDSLRNEQEGIAGFNSAGVYTGSPTAIGGYSD